MTRGFDATGPIAAAVAVTASVLVGRWPDAIALNVVLSVGLIAALVARPFAGLMALVVGNCLNPISVSTGTETDLGFAVLFIPILAAIWLAQRLVDRDLGSLRSPVAVLSAVLSLSAVVSFAWANAAPPVSELAPLRAQLGGMATFLFSTVVLLVASQWVDDHRRLLIMQSFVLLLAIFPIAVRAVPELFDYEGWLHAGGAGCLLWTWSASLAFAHLCLNRRLWWLERVGLALFVAGAIGGGILSNRAWLAGWFPAAIAVLAVVFSAWPGRVAVTLGVAGAGVAAVKYQAVVNFVMVGDNWYSLSTRYDALWIVLDIVALRPLLGIGPANYYFATRAYEIRGHSVSFSSHNNYIDVLAQTGVVGLSLFIAILVLVGWRLWHLRQRVDDSADRAFVCGCIGGLAGTVAAAAIGDWLIPFVYNTTLAQLHSSSIAWLFIGCALALERRCQR